MPALPGTLAFLTCHKRRDGGVVSDLVSKSRASGKLNSGQRLAPDPLLPQVLALQIFNDVFVEYGPYRRASLCDTRPVTRIPLIVK
jgi:hypothetical protein